MAELQGRELDAALARALGFTLAMPPAITGVKTETWRYNGAWHLEGLPMFHRDLNAMHEVEVDLERRGLGEEYAEALIEELSFPELFYDLPTENGSGDEGQETYTSFYGVFQVIHATAEQKARAALAVLNANPA